MTFAESRQSDALPKRVCRHARNLRSPNFAGMRMLLKDIEGLVGAWETPPTHLSGAEMAALPVIENAWLAIDDGVIADFGPMSEFPGIVDWTGLEVVDCSGKFVWPAWCDSHTHLVFARDRGSEFEDRLNGLTYHEIAARGGGILNSARALQESSEAELVASATSRLAEIQRTGTAAVEIKSGYGLTAEAELKMLRVIRQLAASAEIPVRSTFLACHAVPDGMTAEAWTQHAITNILPEVQSADLADFIDVFCEAGYFDLEQTEAVLKAGNAAGLPAKIHANQFQVLGAVPLATSMGALSVDHLEELEQADVEALARAAETPTPVFATALPLCSHFLSIPYTPGRRLIDAGVPLAIATDYNPGSSPSGNMTLAVQHAIVKMRLRPLEAIAAATINGAAAMGLSDVAGAISPGRAANLIVSRKMKGLIDLGYDFGHDPVENVLINGHWMRT